MHVPMWLLPTFSTACLFGTAWFKNARLAYPGRVLTRTGNVMVAGLLSAGAWAVYILGS